MLDVPHELVEHVSWLFYARRRERNSPRRKPGCFKQVLLALAHLRKNETFARLGAGFGVSEATAWRYVDETLKVLAAWAPGLHEALVGLGEGDVVIVDGTLIPTDRIKADEPYYSMKHRRHGINVQVIARPDGTPLWFSRATPGRTHDLTAARAHGIVQACLTRQVLVLADRAYQGAGATVRTPDLRSPRPCALSRSRRTRLRPPQGMATATTSTLLNPTHRPHRPSRTCPSGLLLHRMKEVHSEFFILARPMCCPHTNGDQEQRGVHEERRLGGPHGISHRS
ncbi:Helix-turn-helix of DDE superfamily endonuclease [Streptomyces radiopugnans]|uniref:Helix-turn-helix of DDE superfamily endonuclease n=1 Tax=Streptomyces radiopugnans TaxID=403935 RepID=A0A1H9JCE4_9ACTN|nr:Helix-turn-helix of DDE superfamily endonuclease [Streptomyces radiopugnans]